MVEDTPVHGRRAVLCAHGWRSVLAATSPDAFAALLDVLSCFQAARMRAAGACMQANAVVFSLMSPCVGLFRACITEWEDSILGGGRIWWVKAGRVIFTSDNRKSLGVSLALTHLFVILTGFW